MGNPKYKVNGIIKSAFLDFEVHPCKENFKNFHNLIKILKHLDLISLDEYFTLLDRSTIIYEGFKNGSNKK